MFYIISRQKVDAIMTTNYRRTDELNLLQEEIWNEIRISNQLYCSAKRKIFPLGCKVSLGSVLSTPPPAVLMAFSTVGSNTI